MQLVIYTIWGKFHRYKKLGVHHPTSDFRCPTRSPAPPRATREPTHECTVPFCPRFSSKTPSKRLKQGTMTGSSKTSRAGEELPLPTAPPLMHNATFWRRVDSAVRNALLAAIILTVNYSSGQSWLPEGQIVLILGMQVAPLHERGETRRGHATTRSSTQTHIYQRHGTTSTRSCISKCVCRSWRAVGTSS